MNHEDTNQNQKSKSRIAGKCYHTPPPPPSQFQSLSLQMWRSRHRHRLSSPVSAFVGEDAQLCVVTLAVHKLWHKKCVDFNGGNELYNPDSLLIKSFGTMLRPAFCSLPTRRRSSINTSHQVVCTVTTNMTLKHKHNMNLNVSRLHYCAFIHWFMLFS